MLMQTNKLYGANHVLKRTAENSMMLGLPVDGMNGGMRQNYLSFARKIYKRTKIDRRIVDMSTLYSSFSNPLFPHIDDFGNIINDSLPLTKRFRRLLCHNIVEMENDGLLWDDIFSTGNVGCIAIGKLMKVKKMLSCEYLMFLLHNLGVSDADCKAVKDLGVSSVEELVFCSKSLPNGVFDKMPLVIKARTYHKPLISLITRYKYYLLKNYNFGNGKYDEDIKDCMRSCVYLSFFDVLPYADDLHNLTTKASFGLPNVKGFNLLVEQVFRLEICSGRYVFYSERALEKELMENFPPAIRTIPNVKDTFRSMLKDHRLEVDGNGLVYVPAPSCLEFAKNMELKDSVKEQFRMKVDGLSLYEVKKNFGLRHERVRVNVARVIYYIPYCFEDRFHAIYEKYLIKRSVFRDVFGGSDKEYEYLSLKYPHGNENLSTALFAIDGKMPQAVREKIEMLSKHFIFRFCGGQKEYLPTRFTSIIRSIYENSLKQLSMDEVINSALEYAKNYPSVKMPKNILSSAKTFIRNSMPILHSVICSSNFRMRGFDIDAVNIKEFEEDFHLADYNNMEISARLLMEKYPAAMAKYGIVDEYELHNLIKKRSDDFSLKISKRRSPMIMIGTASKKEQILKLHNEFPDKNSYGLAKVYSERYGTRLGSIAIVIHDVLEAEKK